MVDVAKLVLENYKLMEVDELANVHEYELNFSLISHGVILDFDPTVAQKSVILDVYSPLDYTTLFSLEERKNSTMEELMTKQCLDYIQTYYIDGKDVFNLNKPDGSMITLNLIRCVERDELERKLMDVATRNAPIKDVGDFIEMMKEYCQAKYLNVSQIKNNELRIRLYDLKNEIVIEDGDDAVRYIVYKATGETNLIKSREVVDEVKENLHKVSNTFLRINEEVLSTVFNRHKKIIMALKNDINKSIINKISRMSKKKHRPLMENPSKTFLSKALELSSRSDIYNLLEDMSIRDKFKILNLIKVKKLQLGFEVYNIRNGKVFLKEDTKIVEKSSLDKVEYCIIVNISEDLEYLEGKTILVDKHVELGLPISRKQTMGNLPLFTRVKSRDSKKISSGVYWQNDGGATDLDLSTVDGLGNRTGWGQSSGYGDNSITYSGDITDAYNGAIEFMTSINESYGLLVNIYDGVVGSKAEIVVGYNNDKDKWIDKTVIREKVTLDSKETIIGFVNNENDFIVYKGRLSNNVISGSKINQMMAKTANADQWTVNRLLIEIGIDITTDATEAHDYDLTYSSFTYDKLEELFRI